MPASSGNIPIGTRFGKIVVQSRASTKGAARWLCLCDCGGSIITLGSSLTRERTRSCGCLRKAKIGALNRTHGMSKTPEYEIWLGMRSRCYDPKNQDYHHYAGRGITVCDEWRDSFEAFYRDMGPRPSPKHSIERKDNNKGYSPDNCIWATAITQQRNCRRNRNLTFENKTQCMAAWAEEKGISESALLLRIQRGWTIDDALSIPVGSLHRWYKKLKSRAAHQA